MSGSKVQPHSRRSATFALVLSTALGAGLFSRGAHAQSAASGAQQQADEARKEPRRTPNPALEPVRAALLSLQSWSEGRGGQLSAEVVDTASGEIWAESNATVALNPASNMKILTAAVALSELGSDYRFSTGLYGRIKKGKVPSLVLRGEGDPSFNLEDLWRLSHALERLGVSEVGEILVDQGRFDDQFVPPAFAQQPEEWAQFRAPVSAVAINQNTVTLNVIPGAVGQPARLWFEPAGVVAVEGAIQTRKRGSGQSIQLSLKSKSPNLRPPDSTPSAVPTPAKPLLASVGGHISSGMPRLRFARRLDDPRLAPGLALRRQLLKEGITVTGSVELGGAGQTHRLVFHRSAPLSLLIHQLGKRSDNFYAEMLFKALGAASGKLPARSEDGAVVVRKWLDTLGALTEGTQIRNGSGLFDANRLSARTLTQVLSSVAQNTRIYPEFLTQLSIGGVDGTLRSRLRKLRGLRQVRAKTGTLNSVVSLSGYLLSHHGQAPLAFSFLVNGIPGQAYAIRQRFDKAVSALALAEKAMGAQRGKIAKHPETSSALSPAPTK